jgi:hypothetical protein
MQIWSGRSATFEQKATAGVLAFGALLVAGWLTADSISSSGGKTSTAAGRTVLTVTAVRTIRERGAVVTHDIPVTRRVRVVVHTKQKPVTTTVFHVRTVRTTSTVYHQVPGAMHVVTAQPVTVTRRVTTVEWRVVTVAQRSPTVTITVPSH